MKRESQGNLFKRFILNTIHSINGIKVLCKEEKSIVLVLLYAMLALLGCILLQVSFKVYFILMICFLLLFATELLNTAIENTVDLVTNKYHELAKKAKDQGSAATGVVALITLLVMIYLFIPYIMRLFEK